MSRAVLIMDMPESCDMCDFTDMVNGKMYCGVPGCGELAEDYISCRPDWCPLHQVPEEREENHTGTYEDNFNEGCNTCIDAIGGMESE